MQLLNFDEINKYTEVVEWLRSMKPSELMEPENRDKCMNMIWDLMEYLYVLGFKDAREELGVIAEDMASFLPTDYMNTDGTSGSSTSSGRTTPRIPSSGTSGRPSDRQGSTNATLTSVGNIPPDYMEKKWEAFDKRYDGLDFSDRVKMYAEMGDIQSIVRVVETDGHRIYESGGRAGAEGISHTKTYHTMDDDRVRDTHEYLEGVTIGIDERFYTYDGDSAMFPGDFSLPQNNINCRCWLTYNR